MINEGKKSIHIIKDSGRLLNIPSIKKKIFMDSDYSVIFNTYLYNDKEKIRTFISDIE